MSLSLAKYTGFIIALLMHFESVEFFLIFYLNVCFGLKVLLFESDTLVPEKIVKRNMNSAI